ncbi:hypothetical protein PM082_020484 [Marasmius tenuissimus]|nr:hypothetical protein PM082_020484 [Marasmius tenuissimus]
MDDWQRIPFEDCQNLLDTGDSLPPPVTEPDLLPDLSLLFNPQLTLQSEELESELFLYLLASEPSPTCLSANISDSSFSDISFFDGSVANVSLSDTEPPSAIFTPNLVCLPDMFGTPATQEEADEPTPDNLRREDVATPDNLRREDVATPDNLRREDVATPDNLRREDVATPDNLRREDVATPDNLRREDVATPDNLRREDVATPDNLRREDVATPDRCDDLLSRGAVRLTCDSQGGKTQRFHLPTPALLPPSPLSLPSPLLPRLLSEVPSRPGNLTFWMGDPDHLYFPAGYTNLVSTEKMSEATKISLSKIVFVSVHVIVVLEGQAHLHTFPGLPLAKECVTDVDKVLTVNALDIMKAFFVDLRRCSSEGIWDPSLMERTLLGLVDKIEGLTTREVPFLEGSPLTEGVGEEFCWLGRWMDGSGPQGWVLRSLNLNHEPTLKFTNSRIRHEAADIPHFLLVLQVKNLPPPGTLLPTGVVVPPRLVSPTPDRNAPASTSTSPRFVLPDLSSGSAESLQTRSNISVPLPPSLTTWKTQSTGKRKRDENNGPLHLGTGEQRMMYRTCGTSEEGMPLRWATPLTPSNYSGIGIQPFLSS